MHSPGTTDNPAPSAACQVFGIKELVEEILMHLEPAQILQLQQLDYFTKECINDPKSPLHKKLFLSAEPREHAWRLDLTRAMTDRLMAASRHGYEWPKSLASGLSHLSPHQLGLMIPFSRLAAPGPRLPQSRGLSKPKLPVKQFVLPKGTTDLPRSLLLPVKLNRVILNDYNIINDVLDHSNKDSRTQRRRYNHYEETKDGSTFGVEATFTVPKAPGSGPDAAWRWMFLTNPPCREVLLWPYPAVVDTELGQAVVIREQERMGEETIVFNEASIKVRDVIGALERHRKLVPPGSSYRIRLQGVLPLLDTDVVKVTDASEEEHQQVFGPPRQPASWRMIVGHDEVEDWTPRYDPRDWERYWYLHHEAQVEGDGRLDPVASGFDYGGFGDIDYFKDFDDDGPSHRERDPYSGWMGPFGGSGF